MANDRNDLIDKIAEARSKHARAKELFTEAAIRNDISSIEVFRFDQGYYMGVAHTLEAILEEEGNDDA